jgi:hypothetical protein
MLVRFHNAKHVHRLTQIHQHLSPNLKPRSFPATSDYNIKEKLSRAGSAYSRLHQIAISKTGLPEPDPIIPGYITLQ